MSVGIFWCLWRLLLNSHPAFSCQILVGSSLEIDSVQDFLLKLVFNLPNEKSTLSFKRLSQILQYQKVFETLSRNLTTICPKTTQKTVPKNCPKKLSRQFRTLSWSLFNSFRVPQLYRTISLKISRQNFYESQNFPEIFPENCPWHNICKIFMQNLSPYRRSLPYANFIAANFITAIFQNIP